MKKWTERDIGWHRGKNAIVTGGTDGIGKEVAKELTRHGFTTIIAADDRTKGEEALEDIQNYTDGEVFFEYLNLADLDSVLKFSEKIKHKFAELHVLVNNAGLMAVPERALSAQGHELMFAVNYLGHFALTAQLFPLVEAAMGRIIFQSSIEHQNGQINFFDPDSERFYDPVVAYRQSKLAVLIFALELHRRVRLTDLPVKIIPVHPGGARTNLFNKGPSLIHKMARPHDLLSKSLVYLFGQSAHQGALPALYAATSDEAESGVYYGPGGPMEFRGYPREVKIHHQALNLKAAEHLWELSEHMTKMAFNIRDESNLIKFPSLTKETGLHSEK